jgi:hypothetical protein
LNDAKKKDSTLRLLENSMAGYFEPITHYKFRLSDLLVNLGALETPIAIPKKGMYVALEDRKIRKIAETFNIKAKELADCAETVCKWSLRRGYKIEEVKSSFSASSALHADEIERLAKVYLPKHKLEVVLSHINKVKNINNEVTEYANRFLSKTIRV